MTLSIQPSNILVCEFWNVSPHLDAGIEIAIDAALSGYKVHYLFIGDLLPFCECYIPPTGNQRRESSAIRAAQGYLHRLGCHNLTIADDQTAIQCSLNTVQFDLSSIKCIQELKAFRIGERVIGDYLYSNLCDYANTAHPDLSASQSILSSMLNSYLFAYNILLYYATRHSFSRVYLFNGRYIYAQGVVRACHELAIPVRYHERGCDLNTILLRPFCPHSLNDTKADIQRVWTNGKARYGLNTMIKIGSSWFNDRIHSGSAVIGEKILQFSNQSDIIRTLSENKSSGNHIWSYFWSSEDEYIGLPQDIYPLRGWQDQRSAILDLLSVSYYMDSKVTLVVRLHPNLRYKADIDKFISTTLRNISNIVLIDSESSVSSYDLIRVSNIVFSCGSTISAEACYMGTPSVLMASGLYEDLHPIIKVFSYKDLTQFIANLRAGIKLNTSSLDILKFGAYWRLRARRLKYFTVHNYFSSFFSGTSQVI